MCVRNRRQRVDPHMLIGLADGAAAGTADEHGNATVDGKVVGVRHFLIKLLLHLRRF